MTQHELVCTEEGSVCARWLSRVLFRCLLTLLIIFSLELESFAKPQYYIRVNGVVEKDALGRQNRPGLVSQLPCLPILLCWAHY